MKREIHFIELWINCTVISLRRRIFVDLIPITSYIGSSETFRQRVKRGSTCNQRLHWEI